MYESFYGLSPTPFRLTPNPHFFFEGEIHKRGLAFLQYTFLQKEGFVVITGAPGTGKTELMLNLVNHLPRDQVAVAKVVTSNLNADNMLDLIATSFFTNSQTSSKGVTLKKLEQYFNHQAQQGKQVLLLIDEAHNLHVESLIELSMLSNYQIGDKPVLQCFLIGQESLDRTLDLPELAHLKQRIIVSTRLEPLSRVDTRAYIEHRLSKAGWKRDPEFTKAVHLLIYQYSQGIPRKINAVCNRILLEAYLEEKHIIDHRLALKVIREIQEEHSVSPITINSNATGIDKSFKRSVKIDKRLANSSVSASATPSMPDAINQSSEKPRQAVSAKNKYTHDFADSVVVSNVTSEVNTSKINTSAANQSTVIPDNVLPLKAKKHKPKRTIKKASTSTKTKKDNDAYKNARREKTIHTSPANLVPINKAQSVEKKSEPNNLANMSAHASDRLSSNMLANKRENPIARPDLQDIEFKNIIIEQLAQDQGTLTPATIIKDSEYERLSTLYPNDTWSPFSMLGVVISVLSLFAYWWFIYGPELETTLETFNVISNSIQDKLKQYGI